MYAAWDLHIPQCSMHGCACMHSPNGTSIACPDRIQLALSSLGVNNHGPCNLQHHQWQLFDTSWLTLQGPCTCKLHIINTVTAGSRFILTLGLTSSTM